MTLSPLFITSVSPKVKIGTFSWSTHRSSCWILVKLEVKGVVILPLIGVWSTSTILLVYLIKTLIRDEVHELELPTIKLDQRPYPCLHSFPSPRTWTVLWTTLCLEWRHRRLTDPLKPPGKTGPFRVVTSELLEKVKIVKSLSVS